MRMVGVGLKDIHMALIDHISAGLQAEQQDFIWVNTLEYQHPTWPLILLLADVMSNFLSAFSPRRLLNRPSGDICLSVIWHTLTIIQKCGICQWPTI
ncbi:hypothetical protein F2P79_009090 [Pimephales promelas]|nr:hypothetical protein F2P79_009090 [Pimephales promelas]